MTTKKRKLIIQPVSSLTGNKYQLNTCPDPDSLAQSNIDTRKN